MNSISFVDLVFTVARTIKSLPPFHGARWNALLRLAARAACVDLEKICCLLVPERQGQKIWRAGDQARLRLGLDPFQAEAAAAMLRVLRDSQIGEGEFCSQDSLILSGLEIPTHPGGQPEAVLSVFLDGRQALPVCSSEEFSSELATFLSLGIQPWHLEFHTPARIPRPAGQKESFRYAGPDFFATSPLALACLLSRLRRFLPEVARQQPDEGLRIAELDLRWKDMAYNKDRHMRLGGVFGRIAIQGRPAAGTALALVAGQYCGIGKNPRFGLGMYHIPELEGMHRIPVYPAV